jgi:hypothetical protein
LTAPHSCGFRRFLLALLNFWKVFFSVLPLLGSLQLVQQIGFSFASVPSPPARELHSVQPAWHFQHPVHKPARSARKSSLICLFFLSYRSVVIVYGKHICTSFDLVMAGTRIVVLVREQLQP